MTLYDCRMTMLSFRIDDDDAAAVQRRAEELVSTDRHSYATPCAVT